MATVKDKENTVEERLRALYELQSLLSEIDRIKTLRGELPLEVKDLEDSIIGLETRIDNYKSDIKDGQSKISQNKLKIQDSQEKILKYSDQQNNVRNNKEFDHLTKEIEFQGLEIEALEKKILDTTKFIVERKAELDDLQNLHKDKSADLEDKKRELSEIVAETKQEEEKLKEKVLKLEQEIEPRLLKSFKRIRKSVRNGLGIVSVQRDACGGCFNKIPPQRQLDIRLLKKVIVCEYCGRIMMSDEL